MDRRKLVEHLASIGYARQGTFLQALDRHDQVGTILSNTDYVGEHVCTFVSTHKGHTIRRKIYNKMVCQFEIGKVQDIFGGHLAEYVACPNEHLRKTFQHDDVQQRGISRVEISIYGCVGDDPLEHGDDILESTLGMFAGRDLFFVQPASKQWENFSSRIDRCCLFADHPKKIAYMCWYGHSETGKMGGVQVRATHDIKKIAMGCIADFGFHSCPIFRVNLLEAREDGNFVLAPLRCYTKDKDATTILCPCKKSTKRYLDTTPPCDVLAPSKHISWVWRDGSPMSIGRGKLHTPIQEQRQRGLYLFSQRGGASF